MELITFIRKLVNDNEGGVKLMHCLPDIIKEYCQSKTKSPDQLLEEILSAVEHSDDLDYVEYSGSSVPGRVKYFIYLKL